MNLFFLLCYLCKLHKQHNINMRSHTRTVAVINQSKILVIENGQKLVPIKPICEALGIDAKAQRTKIQEDEILGSTGVLSTSVAGDGKGREMFCLPFKFVFGWLFTINPSNVKEEAREAVVKYKLACYEVLYQSFTDAQEFLEAKQESIETRLENLEVAKSNFKNAKFILDHENQLLKKTMSMTMDEWIAANRQLNIFEEVQEAEEESKRP